MPRSSSCLPLLFAVVTAAAVACSVRTVEDDAVLRSGALDVVDVPLESATAEEKRTFDEGDRLFDLALRDGDGLGPLYTRTSCSGCHDRGARGPGLVQKMSSVEADGVTPSADQSALRFGHTVHPLVTAGGKTPIVPPAGVKVSVRVGPPILGRGYLEAIDDAEIERVAREQASRTDGIHGRVNHVTYASEPNPETMVHRHARGDRVIGRFGVKARIATLDEFTADALQGDMGITSPLRPTEIENPDGLLDDAKPGVDVTLASVNMRADYVRLVAIPSRSDVDPRGRELFARASCNACHVPALRTRSDYPIAKLAGIDAPVYTDLLLHDMGTELADGLPNGEDGEATSRDWKTAPLVGLRFMRNYLHDSRAHSIEEAIRAHGGEALGSRRTYETMSDDERALLLAFVGSL